MIFAVEVIGWSPETRKRYAGQANVRGWGLNRHLDCGDKDRGFVTAPSQFPQVVSDANAVLPWLEGRLEWLKFERCYDERPAYWLATFPRHGDRVHTATPTFARAAVVALIRAKRESK